MSIFEEFLVVVICLGFACAGWVGLALTSTEKKFDRYGRRLVAVVFGFLCFKLGSWFGW